MIQNFETLDIEKFENRRRLISKKKIIDFSETSLTSGISWAFPGFFFGVFFFENLTKNSRT